MVLLRYGLFLMALCWYDNCCALTAGQQKAKEVLRGIEKVYHKVFAGRNIVVSDFSQNDYEPWFYALATLNEWINQLFLLDRPLGSRISEKNKTIIEQGVFEIQKLSTRLIETIRECHIVFEREKNNTLSIHSKISGAIKMDMELLQNAYSSTMELRKNLAPGLLDVSDTVAIKTVLQKIFMLLQDTIYKKIQNDYLEAIDKKMIKG